MKEIIKIAVNKITTTVNTIEKEVDLPDEAAYYAYTDDGCFFAEGLILFAFIPRYPGGHTYDLIQVRQNKQDYTDFHPTSDCKDDYFLDYKGLRNKGLDILTSKNDNFKLITKEEFDTKRIELLNYYQKID